eukprot:1150818-Pelagomonas_calceolata.AAC.1
MGALTAIILYFLEKYQGPSYEVFSSFDHLLLLVQSKAPFFRRLGVEGRKGLPQDMQSFYVMLWECEGCRMRAKN